MEVIYMLSIGTQIAIGCLLGGIVITFIAIYMHTRKIEEEQEQEEMYQAIRKDVLEELNQKQPQQPQTKHSNGQPTKDDIHNVINFMHQNNIIDHKTHDEIIRKSLPYIM